MTQLGQLVATAEKTLRNLNTAVTTLRNHAEATQILQSAIPLVEQIMRRPDSVESGIAAHAMEAIYSAEAICSHDAIKLCRNNAHDLVIHCVCRNTNPHDKNALLLAIESAFGRSIESTQQSRLFHAKRHLFGEGPIASNRRRRPPRERDVRRQRAAAGAAAAAGDYDDVETASTGTFRIQRERVAAWLDELDELESSSEAAFPATSTGSASAFPATLNPKPETSGWSWWCVGCEAQGVNGAHDLDGIF